MALRVWPIPLVLFVGAALGQETAPSAGSVPIVQPGAPGQNSKTLSAAAAAPQPRTPAEADISFMQGMIHHHSQAVEMTDLMQTRSHNKKLLALGKRISISQTDEMQYMRQWLEDRGQPAPGAHGQMDHSAMKGHDMSAMGKMDMAFMPLMPGMPFCFSQLSQPCSAPGASS